MSIEELLVEIQKNNRVCPNPIYWNDLYTLLLNTSQNNGDRAPSPPLILAAWHDSPPIFKMARLQEHIKWADQHGAIKAVESYLLSLSEEQWFHIGD